MPNSLMLFSVMIIIMNIASCGDKYDPVHDNDNLTIPDSVSYESDIKKLFDENCIQCHSSQIPANERITPINVNFDDYDSAKENALRANVRIQAGTMPFGTSGLSDYHRALFQKWIDLETPEF